MNIRNMEYLEALNLYDRLRDAGYPVEIYYKEKWIIMIEGVITNSETKELMI